jgi:two-component system chemotaxis sensor kinase CheA
MAALLVEADGAPFAIPLDRIERTVRLPTRPSARSPAARCSCSRDGVLPIVDASERYGGPATGRRVRGRRPRRQRALRARRRR